MFTSGLTPYISDLIIFSASASPATDHSQAYQATCVAAAMAAALPGAPQRHAIVGVNYGGFVAYHPVCTHCYCQLSLVVGPALKLIVNTRYSSVNLNSITRLFDVYT